MKKKDGYSPRLVNVYHTAVVPAMVKAFGYKNSMQAPRLKKIVVNIGVSEARENIKVMDIAAEELEAITGQKAQTRRAKKSISNFKLRQGLPIGLRVTLRGAKMYEFFDRLVNVAMPRIRDFRGLPDSSFDGRGNLTIGLEEQIIFPEVEYDKVKKVQGMDITFVTTAEKDPEAKRLLEGFGFPFRKSS